jgi:hypothetical protein
MSDDRFVQPVGRDHLGDRRLVRVDVVTVV